MAEALGAASAVITLLDITTRILDEGYSYIRKVKKAQIDIKKLLTEVSAIDVLLSELRSLSDTGYDTNNTLTSLVGLGHLQNCNETLLKVQSCVEKCIHVDGERVKNAGRSLIYPFKEGQLKGLLAQLESHRRYLSDAVVLDSR